MTQPYDIPVNLDTSGMQAGASAGVQALTPLQAALAGVTIGAGATYAALDRVGRARPPSLRSSIADAAAYQAQTSGLAATASATGQSLGGLRSEVQLLSRQLPGGTQAMIAAVTQVEALGVTSKNQRGQVQGLTTDFVRLGAATSTSVPQITQDFGQLNRQLSSLDPTRVSKMSDVVTTLQARTGAAAEGQIAFAQSIAPVAQQAGLGETAILGISSSFVKLGTDGGAAATAVNKILGDLNSSVREGSDSMVAYANAVGMTQTQFRKLYESNPAAALTKVTQAIATSGSQGQYTLQTLGLDGVRTQNALLELSQSGGLGSTINTAVGAYGNGSTAKAASAAFNNVDAQMQKLTTTGTQLADAFGTPLLRPLGSVLSMVQHVVGPLAALANSRGGQMLLGAGVIGGGGALLAGSGAIGAIAHFTPAALGYNALTSGPVASAIAGRRVGRLGDAAAYPEDSWRGRQFNQAIAVGAGGTGPMGGRLLGNTNRGIFDAVRGYTQTRGAGLEEHLAGVREGGRSLLGSVAAYGSVGLQGYGRLLTAPFRQSRQNAMDRDWTLTQPGGPGRDLVTGLKGAWSTKDGQAAGGELAKFNLALGGTTDALKRTGTSLLGIVGDVGGAGVSAVKGGGRLAGSLIGSAAGALGPVGLLAGAGIGAYSLYQGSKAYNSQFNSQMSNSDIYSTLNTYRDSMGEAGVAAQSFADQVAQASQTVAKGVTSQSRARTITGSDIQAFGQPTGKAIRKYSGSNSQVAAQIAGINLNGMTPQDLQSVKQDLYNQGYAPNQIDAILKMVPGAGGTGGQTTSSITSGLIGTVQSNVGAAAEGSSFGRLFGLNSLKRGIMDGPTNGAAWQNLGKTGYGHPDLDSTSRSALGELVSTVGQGYANNLSGGKGQTYSTQTALRQAQDIMAKALDTHNADTVVATEQALTSALTGGKGEITGVSAAQIQGAGGLSGLLQSRNVKVYGQTIDQWAKQGVTFGGAGVSPAHQTPADVTALPGGRGNPLAGFFSGGAGGATGAVTTAMGQPESAPAQTTAVIAMIASLTRAGDSLTHIATISDKALGTTSGAQNSLLAAVLAQAQFRQQTSMIGQTQGQRFATGINAAAAMANVNGNDQTQIAQRQQGQQQLQGYLSDITSYYQQRVMAQYNYQITSERADQDYARQTLRAQEDNQLQLLRSQEDFQLQQTRSRQDYNLNLKREIQDAETTDYNPYQRVPVAQVFDAGDLESNLRAQNTAETTQTQNLAKARADGLSAAAIRTLGLSQTTNAQQLQQLIDDFANDPNVIAQINKTISARGADTSKLFKDDANTTYARQKQDFDVAVARAQQDYSIARSRQEQDFQISMSRAAQDFNTQMARMQQDLQTSDLEVTGNMTKLHKDMVAILHGQTVDWKNSLINTLDDTLHQLNGKIPEIKNALNGALNAAGGGGSSSGGGSAALGGTVNLTGGVSGGGAVGDAPVTTTTGGGPAGAGGSRTPVQKTKGYVTPGTGDVASGTGPTGTNSNGTKRYLPSASFIATHPPNLNYNQSIAKSMAPGWAKGSMWSAWNALEEDEAGWNQYAQNPTSSAYGIAQAINPPSDYGSVGKDWRTNPATQIAWMVKYIKGRYGNPEAALAHENKFHWYANGGIAMRPQVGVVGEGGSPEAMIPLNAAGMKMLAGAMKAYIGVDDARSISSGGRAHAIAITYSTHHYDQRLDFRGSTVEVVAQDPAAMGKALEVKTRRDNLTGPKGVSVGSSS